MLDRLDLALLRSLEADGRQSFAALGEAVGLSKTPCWTRVQALERAGVIRGYRAVLDPVRLGLTTVAFVAITVAFEQHDAFERALALHPRVIAAHATVGESDYLLQVLTPGMDDLDDFLRQDLWRLPGVKRFTTTIAMRTVKSGGSLADQVPPAGQAVVRGRR